MRAEVTLIVMMFRLEGRAVTYQVYTDGELHCEYINRRALDHFLMSDLQLDECACASIHSLLEHEDVEFRLADTGTAVGA